MSKLNKQNFEFERHHKIVHKIANAGYIAKDYRVHMLPKLS